MHEVLVRSPLRYFRIQLIGSFTKTKQYVLIRQITVVNGIFTDFIESNSSVNNHLREHNNMHNFRGHSGRNYRSYRAYCSDLQKSNVRTNDERIEAKKDLNISETNKMRKRVSY